MNDYLGTASGVKSDSQPFICESTLYSSRPQNTDDHASTETGTSLCAWLRPGPVAGPKNVAQPGSSSGRLYSSIRAVAFFISRSENNYKVVSHSERKKFVFLMKFYGTKHKFL